jgi:predicted permease
MGEIFRRIRYLINRRRFDVELANDMEFHREMAARAGRNNFGNTLRIQEQAREAWGWTWLDRLFQDLRYAVRILARSPGFTLTAVLVLAIGIGVNVAAFTVFDLVALEPLPVRDPGSLVRLERRSPNASTDGAPNSSLLFYEKNAKTLSAVMGVLGVPPMQVDGDMQQASASFITPNYFTELGTPAAIGRLFDPKRDGDPAAPPSVVISYGFWQRRFGGDPSVVGRIIHIDKKPATIIGVLPYAFASLGGQRPDIWMPIIQQPYFVEGSHTLTDPGDSSIRMWGRLAPGVSAKTAGLELRALTDELRHQHPKDIWDKEYIQISPGGHMQVMQPEMYQVGAMVAVFTLLILAVACANLGGLMLARAVTREREIGIRVAIGANRGRIFRQLCTESLLLAMLGALAGLALGCAVMQIALTKMDMPKWVSAVPDWRVLLFTVAVMFAAAVFFGLMPAVQVARQRRHKTIARQFLVGAQVAASCVLLIVAGLLVRATQHALYTDPGFGYQQMLSIDPRLGRHGYAPAAAQAYFDQMQARLRATPGVRSVALVKLPPLGHEVDRETTEIAGHKVLIYPNWVEPGFFQTMNIPILLGRTFYPREKNAVIVSQSFARRQWPNQNPIGQRLGDDDATKSIVVGVAGNAHINALSDDDATEQYWSAQPGDMPDMVVVARTAGAPDNLLPIAKSISESLDPKILPEIRRLKILYHDNISGIENAAMAVSLIGMIAVLVSGIGIIGLVAFTVSQRMKEIAIRIALGAKRAQVLSAVLLQFSWPVLLGLVAGTGITAAASKVLRIALYGINNLDPLSYASAIFVLIAIIFIAALLPARHALRLDLAKTLHSD